VIRLNQRRMSRDQTLTCFTSQTTVGRRSARRAGRTRTTASRRVVAPLVDERTAWKPRWSRRSPPRQCARARRDTTVRPLDGGASTQQWARMTARGSRRCLGPISSPRAGSLVGRQARSFARCGAEEGAERPSGR
jgi:hypothetical protein